MSCRPHIDIIKGDIKRKMVKIESIDGKWIYVIQKESRRISAEEMIKSHQVPEKK